MLLVKGSFSSGWLALTCAWLENVFNLFFLQKSVGELRTTSGTRTCLRPEIWDQSKTAGSRRNASDSSSPSPICERVESHIVSGSGCKEVNINCTTDRNSLSPYLKASSNLKLSHVVRTQRKAQNLGSIPALSDWIFPQPRTALKTESDVKQVSLNMQASYHSATHFDLICVS